MAARFFDREVVRELVVDANDGIMAVAGIAEGFIGAGAGTSATLIAVLAGSIAGSIALAGAKFTETAIERDAHLVVLDEVRRQLNLSPDEELRELAALYEAKGLSPALASRLRPSSAPATHWQLMQMRSTASNPASNPRVP